MTDPTNPFAPLDNPGWLDALDLNSRKTYTEAEVAALKAERDEWKRLYWLARSFAVHDDDCTINRHPHYRDCSCGLRAALQPTTPEEKSG